MKLITRCNGTTPTARALLLVGLLFLASSCVAQNDRPAVDSELDSDDASSDAADVYRVRGEVVRLPGGDDPTRGFYFRHEAIDDFRGADGSVWGMDSMTMQFPLADPSLLEGVSVGDKLELTYEVRWQGARSQRVTEVRKLPGETVLEFRKARPPADR